MRQRQVPATSTEPTSLDKELDELDQKPVRQKDKVSLEDIFP